MYANYFASKKSKFVVISSALSGPEFAAAPQIPVSGLAEARKVAAAHGAKPWNF